MRVLYKNPNPLYPFEEEIKVCETNGWSSTSISVHKDDDTGELWVVENSKRWGQAGHYICKLSWLIRIEETNIK